MWSGIKKHFFLRIKIKDFYYNHQSVYMNGWSVLIHPRRSCTNCFYQLSIIKNWILIILTNDHLERIVPSERVIAHKFCELKSLHLYRTNPLSVRENKRVLYQHDFSGVTFNISIFFLQIFCYSFVDDCKAN